jgi:DNA adenine methylase
MREAGSPRPFLKWAGGKSQLLAPVLERLPKAIATYYEPFVGGGAVFFALATRKRFTNAVLSDSNEDLINVYRALRDDADAVIRILASYEYAEAEYYRVRAAQPTTAAARAARIIYLNKTGYNGLYRVNRSGQFNVPFGRYTNPTICDEPNLKAVAEVLQSVKLEVSDFERACAPARPGDAVYFDPPYLPVSKTASFTAYDRGGFNFKEHQRLAQTYAELARRGVHVVLSNSDTPETRALFASFDVATVHASRHINSNATRRGAITEILVSRGAANKRRARKKSSSTAPA